MAFNQNKTSVARNQFVINFKSRKTDRLVSWMNLTDTFAKAVCGEELKNITVGMLEAKGIPESFSNAKYYVELVDTTSEQTTIPLEEF